MKCYLLALGLLLAGPAVAQSPPPTASTLPIDPATHLIAYSGIVAVPGTSSDELYARGQLWFASAFYATQSVILVSDPQAGFLLGQGFAYTTLGFGLLPLPVHVRVWCTIKLSFKEGKYRYLLTDFYLREDPSLHHRTSNLPRGSVEQLCFARQPNGTPTKRAVEFSQGLDQVAQQLIASLQGGMKQAAGGGTW